MLYTIADEDATELRKDGRPAPNFMAKQCHHLQRVTNKNVWGATVSQIKAMGRALTARSRLGIAKVPGIGYPVKRFEAAFWIQYILSSNLSS